LRFPQRFDDAETGELIHPALRAFCDQATWSRAHPESVRVQQRALPFTEKVSNTYMN